MDNLKTWLIQSSEDFQFLLFLVILFIMMVVEHFWHLRTVKRGKRWMANFIMTFIAILAMFSIPVSFITAAGYAEKTGWGLFNRFHLPLILVAILTLLLRGFISFFTHYLSHKIPLLWRIHRVHHLDTELDVSTNVRFHPFEFFIIALLGVPFVLIFGFPVWVLLFYELFDVVITLVSHSNISLPKRLERFLRYIIVTPDLHRVHHSSHQPETDSNFGAVFPIWDIVFRTFRTKTRVAPEKMEIGLKEVRDARVNNIVWLLLSPFIRLKK